MNKTSTWLFVVLAMTLLLFNRCTKPTLVGSELVNIDQTLLGKEDSFTIISRSFPIDSFESYRASTGTRIGRYSLGFVEDPFFGTSKTTFYFELVPSYGFNEPVFAGAVLDSLVLTIAADTSFIAGTPLGMPTMNVFRLQSPLPKEDMYSTRSFSVDPSPIGSYTGPVWPIPVYSSVEYSTTIDTVTRSQFRIRLDDQLGLELMGLDSANLVVDSLFISKLKGFAVEFANPMSAYVGLLFNNTGTNLDLYYTVQDTLKKQARWIPVSFPSIPRTSHLFQFVDRQTATYPNLLLNNMSTDSVHFLQGLAGNDIELYFPNLPSQELVLVNYASLEFTVCPIDGESTDALGPPDQIEIYTYDTNGSLVLIDDVGFASSSGLFGLQTYFGGTPVKDTSTGMITYRCNVSAQIQKILEGRATPLMYVRPYNRQNTPKRTTLCGASSSHPPKLTITYTRLNT